MKLKARKPYFPRLCSPARPCGISAAPVQKTSPPVLETLPVSRFSHWFGARLMLPERSAPTATETESAKSWTAQNVGVRKSRQFIGQFLYRMNKRERSGNRDICPVG